jgi:quinol monooxygenase YgiN
MTTTVSVIATFTPLPGKEQEVGEVLRAMIAPTRAEPGNLRYELYRDMDLSAVFVLIEMYKDQAAVEAHRAGEHYKAYRACIPELLSAPIKVQLLREIDADR